MKRLLFACAAFAVLGAGSAMAACPTPLTITGLTGKDATPTTQTIATILSGGDQYPGDALYGNQAGSLAGLALNPNCGAYVGVLDGDIVTLGSKADAADTTYTNTDSLMAFIKGQVQLLSTMNTNILAGTGSPGGAVLASTMQTGGSDGTNLRTFLTDTSGRQFVNSLQSGAWNIGGLTGVNQSGAITRASNTTAYAANELVCLNASVTVCAPIQVTIAGASAATGTLGRVVLGKTGGTLTNANFTIWLFSAAPTVTSKFDASAYAGPFAADLPNYLGAYSCTAMQATADGTAQAFSECAPTAPQGWMQYKTLSGQQYVDALITTGGAYTPISAEVFTIYANSYQDK